MTADRPVYALLAAGSGTRMGPLTSDRAKVLVEVGGRTLLDRNLRAIAEVAPDARVLVIGGYGADTVAAQVARLRHRIDAETLLNPDYLTSGPLRSVAVALDNLADAALVTIGNGDTIFEPAALHALAAAPGPAALLVDAPSDAVDDDVQVVADGARILRAAKRLAPPGALPVSAGLFQLRGADAVAQVRMVVRDLIAEEDGGGKMLTWHSIIAALAQRGMTIAPVQAPAVSWFEFDSPDCIARYEAGLRG